MVKPHLPLVVVALFVLSGLQEAFRLISLNHKRATDECNCNNHMLEIKALKEELDKMQKKVSSEVDENVERLNETEKEQNANETTRLVETPWSEGTGVTPTRVVLLTSQVSGSSWLARTLDQNPGMRFKEEALIRFSRMPQDKWRNVSWNEYRTSLDRALTSENKTDHYVGFKLMYDQIPEPLYPQFTRWLNDNGIKVIHLTRNALMRLASQDQKIQRLRRLKNKGININLNHVNNETKHYLQEFVPPKVQFTPNVDVHVVNRMEQNVRDFETMIRVHAPRAPMFSIRYEDLDGPHKVLWFNALNAFLGIDFRLSGDEGDLIKVGGRSCEDRVAGLDRNYKALFGTRAVESCAALRSVSRVFSKRSDPAASGEENEEAETMFWPRPLPRRKNARCNLVPARMVCP